MKKTFLFCTKIWFYLSEIAPIALLLLAVSYNDNMKDGFKLYPLIFFSVACIIFIFLYFFRMIIISKEEIRSVGLFSSRDMAVIEKDTTLILTVLKNNKLRVELNGKSKMPDLSWAKKESFAPTDINLYREKAIGGKSAVNRVLKYFGISLEDAKSLLNSECFSCVYDYFEASVTTEDEIRRICIKFTKTV